MKKVGTSFMQAICFVRQGNSGKIIDESVFLVAAPQPSSRSYSYYESCFPGEKDELKSLWT